MGKSASPPQAPDPVQTANAQTGSNIATANATAQLNRVNQNTPWGNLTYTKTPGTEFDQTGYDKAMQDYQNALSSYYQNRGTYDPMNGSYSGGAPGEMPKAPDRSAFTKEGVDSYTSTVTLDPAQQALLNQQNQMSQALGDVGISQLGNVQNVLGQPFSFAGMPQVNQGNLTYGVNNAGDIQKNLDTSNIPALVGGDKLSDAMKEAQQAAFNQQKGYLDPQYAQQQHDLETKLANQGVMQNSDAWNRAMDDFARQRNFDYTQAFNNSVGLGNQAQAQLFGQGLAANQNAFGQALNTGQFSNQAQSQAFGQGLMNAQLNNAATGQAFGQSLQARNQAINELMTQREQPLNELNALRTGSQVTSPQFGNVPGANVAGTDVAGIIGQNYANQMGAYNAQVAGNNSLMGGLFGLGASALMSPVGTFRKLF